MKQHKETTITNLKTEEATATELPKKRKRGGHNSACWICRRDHRACDVGRPCKRCVAIGTADECTNPPPKKEARPKKRKFFIITNDTFAAPLPSKDESDPVVPDEQKQSTQPTFLNTPQPQSKINQFSGWHWQQQISSAGASLPEQPQSFTTTTTHQHISINQQLPSPALKHQRTPRKQVPPPECSYRHHYSQTPAFTPFISPSNPYVESPFPELEREHDFLLVSLLQEIQQLNETTVRLKQEQSLIGKQLQSLQQPTDSDDEFAWSDVGFLSLSYGV